MKKLVLIFFVMLLFFMIMYAGEAFIFTQVLPGLQVDGEIMWSVMLSSVFEVGLITCFALYITSQLHYISSMMKKNRQDIELLLKNQLEKPEK